MNTEQIKNAANIEPGDLISLGPRFLILEIKSVDAKQEECSKYNGSYLKPGDIFIVSAVDDNSKITMYSTVENSLFQFETNYNNLPKELISNNQENFDNFFKVTKGK